MNSPNNHITHTAMRYYCSRPYINHDTPPGCSSSMYLRRNSQPNGTAERETVTERSGQPYGAQIYSEIIEQPYVNYSNNYYKQTLENSGDIYKTPYNFAEELEKSGIIERTANTQEDYVAEIREMLTDKDTREQLKELIRETEGRRTQSDDEEERRRRRKHRHKRRRKRSSSSDDEKENEEETKTEKPQTEQTENSENGQPEKFTKITVEHEALPVKIIPLNIPRNDGEQSPRSVSPRSPKSPRNDKPEKKKKGLKLRKKNKIKND